MFVVYSQKLWQSLRLFTNILIYMILLLWESYKLSLSFNSLPVEILSIS